MLERVDFDCARLTAIAHLDKCAGDVVADLLPESTEKGIDLGFDQVQPVQIIAEPS